MERDKNRKKLDGELESKSQEINSNSSTFDNRKKKSRKKHCSYLHEWLDKSYKVREETGGLYRSESDQLLNPPSQYWPHPPSGHRVFADGATMCHYPVPSVPLGYAVEPFYTMYQPPMQVNPAWAAQRSAPPARDTPQRLERNNSSSRTKYVGSVWAPGKSNAPPPTGDPRQEFTSLPPDSQSRDSDASRRRFSDPGLGPSPSGNEQSASGSDSCSLSGSHSSSAPGGVVLSLVEQVNALRDSNRRLCRQLRSTRSELQTLKVQVAACKQTHPTDYQPGLLADLVREVRDASRIREEALLSRLHNLSLGSVPMANGDHTSQGQVADRLARLEHQLIKLQLHNRDLPIHSRGRGQDTETSNGTEVSDLEAEKVELRCKLQEAVSSRNEAELHAQTLEKLVGILRKKINGVSVDEKPDPCPSSLENTSESLASICSSSGSTHSALVTMSGPVTDL